MDTKRHYSKEYFDVYRDLFLFKHIDKEYDIVAVTDDNAIQFVLSLKNSLFKDVPLFFCGANALQHYDFSHYEQVYGIREKMSLEDTVDVVHKLQPDVEKLYFLFDDSRTSQLTVNDMNSRLKVKYPELNYEVYKAPTLINLRNYVADKNDENAAFIYAFFMIDQQNIAYDPNYSAEIVANTSILPVYGLWNFSLDTGVVGGRMISGYQQGSEMGKLLIQYLDDDLNVAIGDSTIDNQYIFDYAALNHHQLSTWALPKTTQFINKPVTFYERHKNVLLGSFAVAVLLIIYILILQAQVKSKTKQIEKTTHHLMEYKRQASLNQLISGVAHDINTPAGNIFTTTDYALHLTPEDEQYANKIQRSLMIINSSISQIQSLIGSFKRVAIHQEEHRKDLNLKKAISEIYTLVNTSCDVDINFSVDADDSLEFPISQAHLFDIFEPLMINSIQHGFVSISDASIHIKIMQTSEETTFIYEDNGIGLQKNNNDDDIFEPFYSTAKHLKHSGLGLFGVKNTITSYCGTIRYDKNKEKGVKFIITLPTYCSLL